MYVNKYPTRCNYTQLILSANCSTCFGWFLHPSSGAQITVSTASGTGQPLLLPVAIVVELRMSLSLNSTRISTGSNNGWLVDSSWNVMVHGDAWEGKWSGNWRMEWVASTLHTTSEHGVSSITTADAHTSAASSRSNWRPRPFKWTRLSRRKTKCGFCACSITFQLTFTSCCRYSYLCSWWWVEKPTATCRAVYRFNSCILLDTYWHNCDARSHEHKIRSCGRQQHSVSIQRTHIFQPKGVRQFGTVGEVQTTVGQSPTSHRGGSDSASGESHVMHEVALGEALLSVLSFPPVRITPPMLHTNRH